MAKSWHSEVLQAYRSAPSNYGLVQMNAPWALDLHLGYKPTFLVVVSSDGCVLRMRDGSSRELKTGDIAILCGFEDAVLASEGDVEPIESEGLWLNRTRPKFVVMRNGESGGRTVIICRSVHLDNAFVRRLFESLPPIIHAEPSISTHAEWIKGTLKKISSEVSNLEQGSDVLVMHLADALVMEAVRTWVIRNPDMLNDGFATGMDRRIAHAVDLMHREPDRDWSVESLAKATGMSRSAFAGRFTKMVGRPAMRYLAQLRMSLALGKLTDGGESISTVSSHFGYSSEAAFSRAFRRYLGVPPSTVRSRKHTIE